ncbi:hypothetical protein [Streptomyces sp. NPDC127098]|uniref:hypothetical protein n=1 Tax=Streptomyces sp. NPDC127098 TaxID=3347137 RepID=UPI0036694588
MAGDDPIAITVGQLINQLRHYPSDAQVRLALRPDFPFTHHIGHLLDAEVADAVTVYIPQGPQDGYLPAAIRTALGWPPQP